MPDREKTIEGLKELYGFLFREYATIPAEESKIYYERTCAIRDAIALLKEQEAVEPTLIREGRNKNYNDYVCPRCDNEVVYEQNYCSECGIQFLWKDGDKNEP